MLVWKISRNGTSISYISTFCSVFYEVERKFLMSWQIIRSLLTNVQHSKALLMIRTEKLESIQTILAVKILIMAFINAVLSHGPGQESLEFRLHLRNEFLQLGFMNSIKMLREHKHQAWDRQWIYLIQLVTMIKKELARKIK